MTIIRVLDLETTGLEAPEHAPCEVGWTDIERGEDGVWRVGESYSELCNPGRPIPAPASAIHHIIDEDVADKRWWTDLLRDFVTPIGPLDSAITAFAAHNSRFDGQWITEEVRGGIPLLDTYRAALRLYPDAPSHSNQALRYHLKPEGLPRDLGPNHRALGDSRVTAFLLRDFVNGGTPIEKLVEWSGKPAILPKVGFGKHFGKAWGDVPADYLDWMLKQRDMGEDIIYTARVELWRREQRRLAANG